MCDNLSRMYRAPFYYKGASVDFQSQLAFPKLINTWYLSKNVEMHKKMCPFRGHLYAHVLWMKLTLALQQLHNILDEIYLVFLFSIPPKLCQIIVWDLYPAR